MPFHDLPTVSAVIVAGGIGARFGADQPKQLFLLGGRPVLSRTISVFEKSACIDEIIVVVPADWREVITSKAVVPFNFSKLKIADGGETRTESTRRGFAASSGEVVLVHDGVRPLVTGELIEKVAAAAARDGAALAAAPSSDTLKVVADGRVVKTLDRGLIWRAQTPQGFRRDVLAAALASAAAEGATDDAALAESLGRQVTVVESTESNIKITAREDLELAEARLQATTSLRIGQGYDMHRLTPGRPLWLGCLNIPNDHGLMGHSDADVLAHALIDALLGAAGLDDIGRHFPDQDPRWAGASGAKLLSGTMAKVREAGFELVNCDVTLIGERPRIGPYRQAMAEAMASAMAVVPAAVNVKATTTEGLDAAGEGRGLAASAAALLRQVR
ncbi:MAG: 2-C-methyl-D-erythritol 4-phosphate cytidylyltransferase [Candidatus Adiutrix sp.]|nr:2-C-methyl-D-erythritol 4-phosphate cytidylyltransferase [Candidatus Adiutrix sp.]